jgi:hypothetical protein
MRRTIERPSISELVRYRLLGLRVRERSLPWVERDLESDGWTRRQLRSQAIVLFGVFVIIEAIGLVVGQSVSAGDLMVPAAWVFILGAQFVLAPRLERSGLYRRRRAWTLAYQRGERGWGWTDPADDRRGGPMIVWALGAFALAAAITVVVRALT